MASITKAEKVAPVPRMASSTSSMISLGKVSHMTTLQFVLSTLIRNGTVTVETPGLDMEELRKAVQAGTERTLEEIRDVVCREGMTDREKVAWIQERLEK